jgi:perosamine synthetase
VFVAVWNAVLYEYSKQHIEVMETDPNTLNMRTDEAYIMTLKQNSAVMVVHNIGNIINVPRLKRLRPDLVFVEDNCEGLFGTYEGIYSGMSSTSLCSGVSFFGNKTITCGEGGAFFTHDKDVYDFIYRSIHHGLSDRRYVFGMLGYNYRMTNIEAALLYDQMTHIDEIRTNKHRVFELYHTKLKGSVVLPVCEENTMPSEWMFVCGISGLDSSAFESYMKTNGIDIRPFFYDIKVHRHLEDMKSTPLSNDVTYFMLPSYPDLTNEQVEYICETILKYSP